MFSVESIRTRSSGDSCSFSHDSLASGNSGRRSETKRTIVFSGIAFKGKTDRRRKKRQRGNFSQEKSDSVSKKKIVITRQKVCVYGDKCRFRHIEEYIKPMKKSKTGGAKGSVALLKESAQLGCASQDSYPRKSIPREPGMLGSKHTWHQLKFWKERVHREVSSKSVHLMSVVFARQNSRTDHMRTPRPKNDAPAKQRGIWRKYLQDQEFGQSYVLCSW